MLLEKRAYLMEGVYIIMPIVLGIIAGGTTVYKICRNNRIDRKNRDEFEQTADLTESNFEKKVHEKTFHIIQDIVIVHTDEKI